MAIYFCGATLRTFAISLAVILHAVHAIILCTSALCDELLFMHTLHREKILGLSGLSNGFQCEYSVSSEVISHVFCPGCTNNRA